MYGWSERFVWLSAGTGSGCWAGMGPVWFHVSSELMKGESKNGRGVSPKCMRKCNLMMIIADGSSIMFLGMLSGIVCILQPVKSVIEDVAREPVPP